MIKNARENIENVFTIEEKINKRNRTGYISDIKKELNRGTIDINKYNILLSRFKENWIIADSLSFSFSRSGAAVILKSCIDNNPWKKYRIVQAECNMHKEYGISIKDYDYKRLRFSNLGLMAGLYVLKARIKSIYRCIFTYEIKGVN